MKALTTAPSDSEEATQRPPSIEEQKESFTAATSQYFTLLSSIDVRLRRQIYALEEADIIPAEAASKDSQSSAAVPSAFAALGNMPTAPVSKQVGGSKSAITGGGLGSLDVGWLNSRNDNVGKEMQAELWEEAQQYVEKLVEEKKRTNEAGDLVQETHEDGQAMLEDAEDQNGSEEMDQT